MSLARKVVRGVLWTTITSSLIRVIGILGTLVLARTLDRDAYGIVMNWSNILLFASALSTLGVGSYLLVYRNEGPETTYHATMIHFWLGIAAIAIVIPLREQLGAWLDSPAIPLYVIGFSASMVLDRIAYIPERLLVRELQFVRAANIRSAGEIAFSAISVGLVVFAGFGPEALVYGTLARSGLKMVLFLARVPRRDWLPFVPFSRAIARRVGWFGAKIWPQAFSGYAVTRADNFYVTAYFGPGVLAEYNLAYNFAEMPIVQIGEQMTDLLMPVFSAIEEERRPEANLRVLGLICLVMFPLAIGLGAVANSLVAVAISRAEWQGMGPMLTVLCGLAVFRPINGTLSSYLNSRGRPGLSVILEVISLAILLVGTPLVGRFDPLATCGVAVASFGIRSIINMYIVARLDRRSTFAYIARCLGPLAACVPLVGGVLGVRYGLLALGVHSALLSLILEVVAGGVLYVGAAFVVARPIAKDFVQTLKDAIKKRRGGA